jgi:SAM-dependent methyltransferase
MRKETTRKRVMLNVKKFSRGDLRIEDAGPTAYVLSSVAHYGVRALLPKRIHRDAAQVHDEYNHERFEYWKQNLTADDYIFGDNELERWVVIDHKLVRGTIRDVRERLLPRLRDRVATYSKPGDLVVEFGAGTGRNLAYLARELPDRRFLGFELTPKSVEDAREILGKFGIPVQMKVQDVTVPSDLQERAAVAYSVQALEQLPDTLSKKAIEQMSKLARNAIVCIEPIRELYPMSIRGIASRLRQYRADYLSKLPHYANELGLHVKKLERIGNSEHPLNEVSEMLVELGG